MLGHLGGVMSPEMATPKLMWLKRHMPENWTGRGAIFDLADYLTFRASGSLARSQCTLTCKWTYLRMKRRAGSATFSRPSASTIFRSGPAFRRPQAPSGSDLGPLTPQAAAELGLTTNCRVATGVIDAYAGALGTLGCFGRTTRRTQPTSGADRRNIELRDGDVAERAAVSRRLGTLLGRRTVRGLAR